MHWSFSYQPSVAARADDVLTVPAGAAKVLAQRCIDCHGADSDEGGVRLNTLAQLGLGERLDLLSKVQEQMFLKQMPPENEEQSTAAEQARLDIARTSQAQRVEVRSLSMETMSTMDERTPHSRVGVLRSPARNMPRFE